MCHGLRQLAQLFLCFFALGDVIGKYQFCRTIHKSEGVRGDFYQSNVAVFVPVPPAFTRFADRGNVVKHSLYIFCWPNVTQGHGQKFRAAVAVLRHSRVVHRHKHQRLQVIDPHRQRIAVKHGFVKGFAALRSGIGVALVHDAPDGLGDQTHRFGIGVVVGRGLVAHAGHHAHQATLHHGHADQAVQGGVSFGQAVFAAGMGIVVEHHGASLAQCIGPDPGLLDGIVAVKGGAAVMRQRATGPGHHFNAFLVFVDKVDKANLAAGELFGDVQTMLHEAGLVHGFGGSGQVQQCLGAPGQLGDGVLLVQ